jgi:hypothetical protein
MAGSTRIRLSLAVGTALLSGSVFASGTGLFLIPIADVLGHREGFAYVGTYGYERGIDPRYYNYNAITVGLFDRVELGFDNDFEGYTTYNVKVQLLDGNSGDPNLRVSTGLANINGKYSDPYAVATYDLPGFRLHGGLWRIDGVNQGFIGTDFPIGNLSGSLEYLGGPDGQTWASVFVPIDQVPGLGLNLSVGFPNRKADGVQHSALLFYGFKF